MSTLTMVSAPAQQGDFVFSCVGAGLMAPLCSCEDNDIEQQESSYILTVISAFWEAAK